MRRARAKQDTEDDIPGGDSFLDIVANIVGILVLLVVVVGVRAGRQVFMPVVEADESAEAKIAALEQQTSDLLRQARRDQRDDRETRRQLQAASIELKLKEQERAKLTLYTTKLRSELDEAREGLQADDQRSLETSNGIAQAQLTLNRLAREQIALASVEPRVEQKLVSVSPKPIVNGRAEDNRHFFRLRDKRLTYVPVEELSLEISRQARSGGGVSLANPGQTQVRDFRAGPLEGFVANARFAYRIRASGNAIGTQTELVRMELVPQAGLLGEPYEQALQPGGSVASRLDLLDPRDATIVLTIYPDSFDAAIDVEAELRQRGFQIAKALLPQHERISFSSRGQEIVTQ